jgi:mRNA-degrading endonuclease RelE of RelBE toxin-antitoxin system
VPKAEVRLSTHARKAYEKLARTDRRLFRRIDRTLDRLTQDPQAGKALHGPLHRHRSLRVGSLRIVYRFEADLLLVLVFSIAERGQAYRDL